MEGMMTVREAAQCLGVDAATVRRRLERGELHGERLHPRMWIISAAEVERFALQRGDARNGRITAAPVAGSEDISQRIARLAAMRARIAARNPAVAALDPAELLREAREERTAAITGLDE